MAKYAIRVGTKRSPEARKKEIEERLKGGQPLKASQQEPEINKQVDLASGAVKINAKLVSDRKLPLSIMKCQEHLDLERFKGERSVDSNHVQELYDKQVRGQFMWDIVQMATATLKEDGKSVKYGVNGQHTAWMRTFVGDKINDPMVRYLEYDVADQDELRKLYSIFDTNKARTHGHLVRAQLSGMEGGDEIWATVYAKLASGFRLWQFESKEQMRRHGSTELSYLIQEKFPELFKTVAMFWQRVYADAPHVKRAGALAAMLATFNTVPTVAPSFWEPVCIGTNLGNKTDPRWVLRETLLRTSMTARAGGTRLRFMSAEDMYRVCISAWLSWRDQKPLASTSALRPTQRRLQPR